MRIFPIEFAGGLSLESEWQQVFSGLHDESEYSSRSQQCCSQFVFDSSMDI